MKDTPGRTPEWNAHIIVRSTRYIVVDTRLKVRGTAAGAASAAAFRAVKKALPRGKHVTAATITVERIRGTKPPTPTEAP